MQACSPPLIIGLDTGLTSTKAVVFDLDGQILGTAAVASPKNQREESRSERNPYDHWDSAAQVLNDALAQSGHRADEVAAVGLAGHGDGLHFIDHHLQPVAPAVLSSDTRAAGLLQHWLDSGLLTEALKAGGAIPFAGSPAPLIHWFTKYDPDVLSRTRWLLTAKDWLRLCLTGEVATDPTDAFSSFTEVNSWAYSTQLFSLYGLESVEELLPPIQPSLSVAGAISPSAAQKTGLRAGTPVVTGMHDVMASHLGSAGLQTGHAAIIAGTFGVNLVLSRQPFSTPQATCRPAAVAGRWGLRRTSPASGANVEWAVSRLADPPGEAQGVAQAVTHALAELPPCDAPTFLPYLFGGPLGGPQSASFLDLRAAHTQVDLLRSVLYGVTFNHRADLEVLREMVEIGTVHLTGGAAKNPSWTQLFADVLGMPVELSRGGQSAALGAAMAAAVGIQLFPDLEVAFNRMKGPRHLVSPEPTRTSQLETSYQTFLAKLGRSPA